VWRHLSILGLACFLTFFAGLGRAAISDSDEAFYAEAAREMIESGDWLTPCYNYEPRFQKPILYYWLAAGTFLVAGANEAAARFPSALAGLGLTLLTYACGRRWFTTRAGFVAGLVVATNFGYFFIGRLALPDLPLAFFITLSSWSAIEVLRVPDAPAAPRARRRWLLLAAVGAALGVLTKGPVGVALPALVASVVALVVRDRRAGWRVPIGAMDLALAALVFLAVAAPWYLAMAGEHGHAYLHRFFVGENLERFATDRYNEPRPIGYYGPIVLGGLLPWSPFMALWLPGLARVVRRQRRLDADEWRLVLWAGLPLIFYSLSIGKQPRYVLPILPPLALLLARSIAWRIERAAHAGRRVDLGLAWCATAGAVVLVTLGVLLHRGKPLLFALDPTSGLVATVVIVLTGLAVAVVAWMGRPRQLVGTMAAASTITLLALHYSVYSAAGLDPVQRMANIIAAHRDGTLSSGTYRVFVRNLVFYTRMKQTDLPDDDHLRRFLDASGRVMCVLSADDLGRLEPAIASRLRQLGQVRYFNAAGLRLRNLLWLDPERDLETVVLVGNR
jgi:4-amino-4-deoxy-L-arabinose transferase-like glycosyltransferase